MRLSYETGGCTEEELVNRDGITVRNEAAADWWNRRGRLWRKEAAHIEWRRQVRDVEGFGEEPVRERWPHHEHVLV